MLSKIVSATGLATAKKFASRFAPARASAGLDAHRAQDSASECIDGCLSTPSAVSDCAKSLSTSLKKSIASCKCACACAGKSESGIWKAMSNCVKFPASSAVSSARLLVSGCHKPWLRRYSSNGTRPLSEAARMSSSTMSGLGFEESSPAMGCEVPSCEPGRLSPEMPRPGSSMTSVGSMSYASARDSGGLRPHRRRDELRLGDLAIVPSQSACKSLETLLGDVRALVNGLVADAGGGPDCGADRNGSNASPSRSRSRQHC
mmetsp:Transcript_39046/g.99736  ORF Transcript_39046/g.99736 Transcript_39046/m.99736 type:complete len:261 (+) Transcript_39046:1723-2505(+)